MNDFEHSPLARDEQERYVKNPLRLLRCAVELGGMAVKGLLRKVDDAMDVDFEYTRIYPVQVEAPVATEEELGGPGSL